MTTAEYLKALARLKLTPMGKDTAEAIGLSMTQLWRLAHGHQRVPKTVAKLLECLLLSRRKK